MVLQTAHFDVVFGIHALLKVQHINVIGEGTLAFQIPVEDLPDIVVVLHIKGGEHLVVIGGIEAALATHLPEAAVHRFRQPDAAGAHLLHSCTGTAPELHGNEGCHVAAETVHNAGPLDQRFDLIVPQRPAGIVQIHHVGPVAHVIAHAAVTLPVEELRVLHRQHRVGRGMVIDHIDDALHAPAVNFIHQRLEILHGAVLRVDGAVVSVGIGAPHASLSPLLSDGVDGHEPDNVRAQRTDAIQIGNDGPEGTLGGMIAHVDGINHISAQADIGLLCHKSHLLFSCLRKNQTPTQVSV